MTDRTATLKALFDPAVKAMGLQLWGVEYLGQGKHSVLRVYIDKAGGIDVEDCAQASRQISSILDVEEPISGEYTLEVSSPGLDRPLFELQHYQDYAGHKVAIRLSQALANRHKLEGIVKSVDGENVVLMLEDEELFVPFILIDKANIIAQW